MAKSSVAAKQKKFKQRKRRKRRKQALATHLARLRKASSDAIGFGRRLSTKQGRPTGFRTENKGQTFQVSIPLIRYLNAIASLFPIPHRVVGLLCVPFYKSQYWNLFLRREDPGHTGLQ